MLRSTPVGYPFASPKGEDFFAGHASGVPSPGRNALCRRSVGPLCRLACGPACDAFLVIALSAPDRMKTPDPSPSQ
jgi:hypothetical protein